MKRDIKIDQQENKFFTIVDGKESVLNFRPQDEGTWEYYRTFVPTELRGQGIAAELVEFALNYARDHNKRIVPSCSYVRSYIDEHPKWSTIVQSLR